MPLQESNITRLFGHDNTPCTIFLQPGQPEKEHGQHYLLAARWVGETRLILWIAMYDDRPSERNHTGWRCVEFDITHQPPVVAEALRNLVNTLGKGGTDKWLQPSEVEPPPQPTHKVVMGWLNKPKHQAMGIAISEEGHIHFFLGSITWLGKVVGNCRSICVHARTEHQEVYRALIALHDAMAAHEVHDEEFVEYLRNAPTHIASPYPATNEG